MKKAIKLFSTSILLCMVTIHAYAQEKVKVSLDNTEVLSIEKNNNGDIQLRTPNDNGNLFLGDESGDNVISNNPFTGVYNLGFGNKSLFSLTNGSDNIGMGYRAGEDITDGSFNIALGTLALSDNETGNFNIGIGTFNQVHNVASSRNISIGYSSLAYIYDGSTANVKDNIAIGYEAMKGSLTASNNTGYKNVAIGNSALLNYTTAYENTAMGHESMMANQTGSKNTALGSSALTANISGFNNVALGYHALLNTTSGNGNVGTGASALEQNTTGNSNIAIGTSSLTFNTTGNSNVAIGQNALRNNVTGYSNTALGVEAGKEAIGFENTFLGSSAGHSANGNRNVFVGRFAGHNSSGNNKLYIENEGVDSTAALIYGEFDNDILRFNGSVGVGISPNTKIDFEVQANGSSDHNIVTRNVNGNGNFIVRADGNSGIRHHDSHVDFSVKSKIDNFYNIITEDIHGNHNLIVRTNGNSGIREANGFTDFTVKGKGNSIYNLIIKDVDDNNNFVVMDDGRVGVGDTPDSDDFTDFTVKGKGNSIYNLIIKDVDDNNNFVVMDDGRVGVGDIPDSGDLLHIENGDGQDVLSVTSSLNPVVDLYASIELQTPEEGTTYPDSEPAMIVNSKFFMNSSGQLSVGHSGTPQRDLHIKQSNSSHAGIRLEYQSDSDYWDVDIDSSNDYNYRFNGSLKGYIRDTDGVYVVSSDRRLKEGIIEMNSTLSKINSLNPVQYRFKTDNTKSLSTGFIAQEVQEIFPEFVFEKEGMLRIGYDYFIPVAIAGIQELSEENKMLKTELEELKAEMLEIKALLKK